jgi:hypothetical protein
MQERRASLFYKNSPSIREFHADNPSIVASEEAKSMLFFDLSDLSAERGLGDTQPVRGAREVKFLCQNDHCMQMPHFNPGRHGLDLSGA